MIKYNNNTINDWDFGTSNIIKVYRNNAVCYYKVNSSGDTPTYDLCYAVVDDISNYQDREFEDVYDKTTRKWYKLNNLNEYEEYGVYASGRTECGEVTPHPQDCVTTYEGKLTVDEGYEYQYSGNSWNNVGEVSGSSRLPQGYTEVEYIENTTLMTHTQSATRFNVVGDTTSGNIYTFIYEMPSSAYTDSNYQWFFGNNAIHYIKLDNGLGWHKVDVRCFNKEDGGRVRPETPVGTKAKIELNQNNYIITNVTAETSTTYNYGTTTTYTTPNRYGIFCRYDSRDLGARTFVGKVFEFKIESSSNVVLYDYIPCTRDSDGKVGLYDIINNAFYYDESGELNILAGSATTHVTYPIYYAEKSDPLDNLTFNTMEDALDYAYNNCVYDGMKAIIDGERYKFDSEDGWVLVPQYYKVEDVTPNQASGWTISGSATYNPDPTYYDDFDLETTSTSNVYKIARVTIYGYENFTYYLRSYHPYSYSYGYVMASNVDELSTDPTSMPYGSSSAITNTYNFNKASNSAVNLSNYRRVTYNNLDKTVEHTFYVVYYGRTYSSYIGNATILIPKEQTNENWEQVTFSASSNVASVNKSLYIDSSNSSNGGTSYFYYRWMIGLPSGSHSSYTNYSNYAYCPNVTSSTFTSVEGETRQVNFTYDNTSNKSLSFTLVDESGNTLTPSDTVYYSMTFYNSCNVSSSSSNLTFPRSQSVKVGGRFYFSNSSNRQYIYGYTAPSTGVTYYVDDYNNTFDIVYTALTREAVTITYTTYDPNDVEVPTFSTDINWAYNGGSKVTTAATSYDVPYTYSYTVEQTNNKFTAPSQTFTASQAARTVSFTLYPNNREFASVADLEAYAYAWEGMKASVDGTKYVYENGEWVEKQHSLPDIPFSVNYNAKNYNANTNTLLKEDGQLVDVDAVISGGTPTVGNGYLTIAQGTRAPIGGYQTYINRDNNNPNLTIISKQRTEGSNCHLFANRDSNYNWMYRCYSNKLTLHGTSEQGSLAVTTQPVIESVRVNSSRLATYNNYTNGTSSTYSNFGYGSTNSGSFAIFAGYAAGTSEWFVGDFYWIYMAQATLTDEQVQQVIDYNENL